MSDEVPPAILPPEAMDPIASARASMAACGQWSSAQVIGRVAPIGCVALEITQRCNLDCTLCYLSESAEAVKDVPLDEVFRRIDGIARCYGPWTNVQITGGEPTLRRRAELVAIVRRTLDAGLRPALFTNGIRASRSLLAELCDAGLREVAFHVDTTQQRRGYADEAALHALRDEYMERARGLPLAVYFNTTVHDGNFADLPMLVRYFIDRSDIVRIASFQLQADTGRGVLGARGPAITPDSVVARIRQGAGTALDFDAVRTGHARCNRYGLALVANGRAYDALDDRRFVARFIAEAAALPVDRLSWRRSARVLLAHGLRRPAFLLHALAWLARKGWQMKRDLLAGRGRIRKLTFFVHNFMDAGRLEQERIDACVLAVATPEGPVSMCRYNAERDARILRPLSTPIGFWNPLTGELQAHPPAELTVRHSRKTARGRAAAAAVLFMLAALAASMAQGVDADQPWARVLAKYVNERGEVDFHGVAADEADLDAFLQYVQRISPRSAPDRFAEADARIAYYLNAYNAIAMFNVIDSGFPQALGPLRRLRFFGVKRFTLGGERLSLYTLENDVIRPLGDERVHFALNCMSVSCPRLPREPFRAGRLSETLDARAREFFAEPRNVQVMPEQKRVRLSSILKFYREDFLRKAPSLIDYVNRYRTPPIPQDYDVEFFDYDWTVNDPHRRSSAR